MVIDISDLSPAQRQAYLQGVVAPRPIALASTINREGEVNLSPFSFFNLFSAHPPIVVFSPARRVRDNSSKHTLDNVLEVPEVVIHAVPYRLVQQVSLSSCEYPQGVDEFRKAGLTPLPSEKVRPPRVAESPAAMECRVLEVKPLGEEGGAGQLVICEVLLLHLDDAVLNAAGLPDPHKMDLTARLGGNWYSRADARSLFEVEKPNTQLGLGFDGLPRTVRESSVLTGNQLAQLANFTAIPSIDPAYEDRHLKEIIQYYSLNPADMERELHLHAAQLLDAGRVADAWQVLLTASSE